MGLSVENIKIRKKSLKVLFILSGSYTVSPVKSLTAHIVVFSLFIFNWFARN